MLNMELGDQCNPRVWNISYILILRYKHIWTAGNHCSWLNLYERTVNSHKLLILLNPYKNWIRYNQKVFSSFVVCCNKKKTTSFLKGICFVKIFYFKNCTNNFIWSLNVHSKYDQLYTVYIYIKCPRFI